MGEPSHHGVRLRWRGRVPYRDAYAEQTAARDGVVAGVGEEALLLYEHPRVVTLGRRGGTVDEAGLRAAGVEVVATERGGLATVHAPGQLVGYPILDLGRRRWAIREVVSGIEDGLIAWLAEQAVTAHRRDGAPGVYVGEAKIGAIGLFVRHHVTMHGFALNLDVPASAYDGVLACGLVGVGVTSVAAQRGDAPTPADAAEAVGRAVLDGIVRRAR
jgi:lipoate-protein ligase B